MRFVIKASLTTNLTKKSCQELNLLKRLNSPFITNLIESFTEDLITCIVIEYCEVFFFKFYSMGCQRFCITITNANIPCM
jgi:serine/threonine protein kinase